MFSVGLATYVIARTIALRHWIARLRRRIPLVIGLMLVLLGLPAVASPGSGGLWLWIHEGTAVLLASGRADQGLARDLLGEVYDDD